MIRQALLVGALVALAHSKAIITNLCPYGVFVWSVPGRHGYANHQRLEPNYSYEEYFHYGTKVNPGVALKISTQQDGIHHGKDEIDFAYTMDQHDSTKIWISLETVRGESMLSNYSLHTCWRSYKDQRVPTRACTASDDVELVLCGIERIASAQNKSKSINPQDCIGPWADSSNSTPQCYANIVGPFHRNDLYMPSNSTLSQLSYGSELGHIPTQTSATLPPPITTASVLGTLENSSVHPANTVLSLSNVELPSGSVSFHTTPKPTLVPPKYHATNHTNATSPLSVGSEGPWHFRDAPSRGTSIGPPSSKHSPENSKARCPCLWKQDLDTCNCTDLALQSVDLSKYKTGPASPYDDKNCRVYWNQSAHTWVSQCLRHSGPGGSATDGFRISYEDRVKKSLYECIPRSMTSLSARRICQNSQGHTALVPADLFTSNNRTDCGCHFDSKMMRSMCMTCSPEGSSAREESDKHNRDSTNLLPEGCHWDWHTFRLVCFEPNGFFQWTTTSVPSRSHLDDAKHTGLNVQATKSAHPRTKSFDVTRLEACCEWTKHQLLDCSKCPDTALVKAYQKKHALPHEKVDQHNKETQYNERNVWEYTSYGDIGGYRKAKAVVEAAKPRTEHGRDLKHITSNLDKSNPDTDHFGGEGEPMMISVATSESHSAWVPDSKQMTSYPDVTDGEDSDDKDEPLAKATERHGEHGKDIKQVADEPHKMNKKSSKKLQEYSPHPRSGLNASNTTTLLESLLNEYYKADLDDCRCQICLDGITCKCDNNGKRRRSRASGTVMGRASIGPASSLPKLGQQSVCECHNGPKGFKCICRSSMAGVDNTKRLALTTSNVHIHRPTNIVDVLVVSDKTRAAIDKAVPSFTAEENTNIISKLGREAADRCACIDWDRLHCEPCSEGIRAVQELSDFGATVTTKTNTREPITQPQIDENIHLKHTSSASADRKSKLNLKMRHAQTAQSAPASRRTLQSAAPDLFADNCRAFEADTQSPEHVRCLSWDYAHDDHMNGGRLIKDNKDLANYRAIREHFGCQCLLSRNNGSLNHCCEPVPRTPTPARLPAVARNMESKRDTADVEDICRWTRDMAEELEWAVRCIGGRYAKHDHYIGDGLIEANYEAKRLWKNIRLDKGCKCLLYAANGASQCCHLSVTDEIGAPLATPTRKREV